MSGSTIDIQTGDGVADAYLSLPDHEPRAGVLLLMDAFGLRPVIEEMADRIGVIRRGEIILVEEKADLMRKLGRKQLTLHLQQPITAIPPGLSDYELALTGEGSELVYTYDTRAERTGITGLLTGLAAAGIRFNDLHTEQSSLEDIFVGLVREEGARA